MDKRLAIIVPYRDRRKQLDIFIPHMDSFLKDKGIDYQIIVAEQRDDRPFNRGKLCNIVFNTVKDDFDYFCFHDVNLLPLTDDSDYSYPKKPTHLASIVDDEFIPYEEFIGGVFLINKEHFEQINGFCDEYWGWGYEDNDLLERMRAKNISLDSFVDISSTSKNERYSFNQVYLYNNFVKKELDTIKFHDTCIEIEPTDSIDNLTSKSFSFSIWVNPNEEDYEQFIITRPPIGLGITYTPNNNFKFTLWSGNTAYVIEDYRIPNEWYHLSMTYDKDSKEFNVYINGSLIDSKRVSSLEDFNGEWFYIGANSKNEQGFTGSVSEITFWNVSLSQDDIRVLYLENVEDLIYNPVLWYKCSRGYGTFVLDETSYKNNGFFKTPSKTDSINFYNLPFGSTERMAMIGDKAKKVGSKFITHKKEEIKLGYKVKMPDRRFGEYKSLSDNGELTYRESILENLQSYDPDILLNSDIFFDEVRLDLLDMDTIGLNNDDFQVSSRKEYEKNHEWLEIIT
tara:strand:+ start:139 stop:1668 length:1530 start_codon:yes stop_codon:yes gene_type:complete